MDVATVRKEIEPLNEKIRPIAERPVAFGPDLLARLAALPQPLDEAGVRSASQNALVAAVNLYLSGTDDGRNEIRAIFRTNRAFAWAATLPFSPDTLERFRMHLAHFSILDQYPDYRDALLWLDDLRKSPFFQSVRSEIAAISSPATAKIINAPST